MVERKDRVWAEIRLDLLGRNLETVSAALPRGTRILAVLKADAYGHGAVPVARYLVKRRVPFLGVGNSSEALALRKAGLTVPILILGAIIGEEMEKVVRYDITPTIHSTERMELLEQACRRAGKRLKVHLKVDTGMGRLGVMPEKALELARRLLASPVLELEGISSHLATSHTDDSSYVGRQLSAFRSLLDRLAQEGIRPPLVHLANSAAVFHYPEACFNLVRCGASLYGIDPGNLHRQPLSPILTLKSQVIFIKDLPPGSAVGYGGTYLTSRPTRTAILPVGYNDGLPLLLSNRGRVLVRGKSAPIVGRISMDYTTVDISHLPGVHVGDEVVLLGTQWENTITLTEVATLAQTIPYQLTCALGKRVLRRYLDGPPARSPVQEKTRGMFSAKG